MPTAVGLRSITSPRATKASTKALWRGYTAMITLVGEPAGFRIRPKLPAPAWFASRARRRCISLRSSRSRRRCPESTLPTYVRASARGCVRDSQRGSRNEPACSSGSPSRLSARPSAARQDGTESQAARRRSWARAARGRWRARNVKILHSTRTEGWGRWRAQPALGRRRDELGRTR